MRNRGFRLGIYGAATPGVRLYDSATVHLDENNEPQPDALLRIESKAVDKLWKSEGDYIENPPELIAEISGSSASYDVHEKLAVYQRNEIQEYLVWQIYENQIDWFQLVEDQYELLLPDEDGIIHSRVFSGLQLDTESLLAGDLAEVLVMLQRGLQCKEHVAFVQQLNI